MVSEKCVDPINRRPYTITQIRDAMKSAGFMVHPTRNVKQQFLDCVKLIQKKKVLDIERAKMQLALVLLDSEDDEDGILDRRRIATNLLIEEGVAKSDILPQKDDEDATRIIFLSDPSLYRKMEGIAKNSSVQGRIEIIQQCVTEEGDVTLGSELERRAQQKQQHDEDRDVVDKVDVESLTNNMQSTLSIKENETSKDENNHYELPQRVTNSRKAQKAQQKKSKKAKRREKEEQAEKDERIAAEKTRQKERAERLGIAEGSDSATAEPSSASEGGDTKPCNTCGGSFTPGEYRSHFRSDWHRYNVKLKMKGVAPISEREFELCDADEFFS